MLTWKDVIHLATKGNPTPDKIIKKTDIEWKEILTPEKVYQILKNIKNRNINLSNFFSLNLQGEIFLYLK